jgi:purine nucleosidase
MDNAVADISPSLSETPVPLAQVALDTDIGTDVDDILAIATILGSPELDVSLVTTVYGDTLLRARMVVRALGIAGRSVLQVIPGAELTHSGRAVWWPGHEGALMDGLESEVVDAGADAIAALAAEETVIAIGPLTNLAAALERPDSRIQRVYLMGGSFADGRVEHNIRSDSTAAEIVFHSGVQIYAVGIDQTERVRLAKGALEQIGEAGPLGRLLASEMTQFWRFAEQDYNVPHDPIAVLMLTRPDLFTFEAGKVSVITQGDREGATLFDPSPTSPHRVVTDLDADAVSKEIVQRILRSIRHSNATLNEENHQ